MNQALADAIFNDFREWVQKLPTPVAQSGQINGWLALSEGLRNLIDFMQQGDIYHVQD